MSRVRFEQIFFFCATAHNRSIFGTQTIVGFCIKILMELLQKQFDSHYILNQQCTIDEAIFPSKGVLGSNSICTTSKVGYIKLFLLFLLISSALPFFEVLFFIKHCSQTSSWCLMDNSLHRLANMAVTFMHKTWGNKSMKY